MADRKKLVASLVAELTKTYPGLDLENLTGKFSDFLDIPLEYTVTSKEKDGKVKVSMELTKGSQERIEKFFEGAPYKHPDPTSPLNSYGKYVSSLLSNLANNKESAQGQKPVREQLFDHITMPDGTEAALTQDTLDTLAKLTGGGKEKNNSITVSATLSDYLFQGGSGEKHNLDLMYNIAKTTAPGLIPSGQFNQFGAVTGDRIIGPGTAGGPSFDLFVETPTNTNRGKSFGLPTTPDVLYGSLRSVTINGKEIPAKGNPDDDSKGQPEQPDLFVHKGAVDEKGNLKPGAKFFAVEQTGKDKDGKVVFDEIKYVIAPPGATIEDAEKIYGSTWANKDAARNNHFQPIHEFKGESDFAQFMTAEKYTQSTDKTKPQVYRYEEVLEHMKQTPLSAPVKTPIAPEHEADLAKTITEQKNIISRARNTQGGGVQGLQEELNYLKEKTVTVDGQYGKLTEAAVKELQQDLGIKVDGKVGKNTYAGLEMKILEKQINEAKKDGISKAEAEQISHSYDDLAKALKNGGGKLDPRLQNELKAVQDAMKSVTADKDLSQKDLGELSAKVGGLTLNESKSNQR